eukprot:Nitzschia sp. Nitz4//scaffold152_size53828//19123//20316//NITZ4_006739-RA/size53828-processed-gene-0.81-mRNA-1//-1//CDS//3329537193//7430//frame0
MEPEKRSEGQSTPIPSLLVVVLAVVLVATAIAVPVAIVKGRDDSSPLDLSLHTEAPSPVDSGSTVDTAPSCNCSLARGRYDLAVMGCGLLLRGSSMWFIPGYTGTGYDQVDENTCVASFCTRPTIVEEFSCDKILKESKNPREWFDTAFFPNTEYCDFMDAVSDWLVGDMDDEDLYRICLQDYLPERALQEQELVHGEAATTSMADHAGSSTTESTTHDTEHTSMVARSPTTKELVSLSSSRELLADNGVGRLEIASSEHRELVGSSCNCSLATSRGDLIDMDCDLVIHDNELLFFPVQTGDSIYRQVDDSTCEAVPYCGTSSFQKFDCDLILLGFGPDFKWLDITFMPGTSNFCSLEYGIELWGDDSMKEQELYEFCLDLFGVATNVGRGANRTLV